MRINAVCPGPIDTPLLRDFRVTRPRSGERLDDPRDGRPSGLAPRGRDAGPSANRHARSTPAGESVRLSGRLTLLRPLISVLAALALSGCCCDLPNSSNDGGTDGRRRHHRRGGGVGVARPEAPATPAGGRPAAARRRRLGRRRRDRRRHGRRRLERRRPAAAARPAVAPGLPAPQVTGGAHARERPLRQLAHHCRACTSPTPARCGSRAASAPSRAVDRAQGRRRRALAGRQIVFRYPFPAEGIVLVATAAVSPTRGVHSELGARGRHHAGARRLHAFPSATSLRRARWSARFATPTRRSCTAAGA